jgi:hypothetical protein
MSWRTEQSSTSRLLVDSAVEIFPDALTMMYVSSIRQHVLASHLLDERQKTDRHRLIDARHGADIAGIKQTSRYRNSDA